MVTPGPVPSQLGWVGAQPELEDLGGNGAQMIDHRRASAGSPPRYPDRCRGSSRPVWPGRSGRSPSPSPARCCGHPRRPTRSIRSRTGHRATWARFGFRGKAGEPAHIYKGLIAVRTGGQRDLPNDLNCRNRAALVRRPQGLDAREEFKPDAPVTEGLVQGSHEYVAHAPLQLPEDRPPVLEEELSRQEQAEAGREPGRVGSPSWKPNTRS